MTSNQYTKQIFLASKSTLNKLINPIELMKTKQIKSEKCSSCPFANTKDKHAINYCTNFCKEKTKTIMIQTKLSKATVCRPSAFMVKNTRRFSLKQFKLKKLTQRTSTFATPLQIKLMLAYFKIANSKGIINAIPKKNLSQMIGCSSKSIDSCNKFLESIDLIKYQKTNDNCITVIITNFEDQYAKKGAGYIAFASNLFNELIKINKMHEMRVAIKAILLADSNNHFGNKTIISLTKLKALLPKYKQKHFAITNFVKNLLSTLTKGLIATPYMNSELIFILEDTCDGKVMRTELTKEYSKLMTEELDTVSCSEKDSKVSTLAQLCLEYSYDSVLNLVRQLDISHLFLPCKDFGGFMRYYLEKSFKPHTGLSMLV